MALFTDGAATTIEDLRGHDSQVLSVANVENIDVTRKLTLAQEEICMVIDGMLGRLAAAGQLTAPPSVGQVVVTAPLKLWHIYRALEMVYADAFNSQLNDRYAGKRDEYHEMARWAYGQLIQSGLGIAAAPMAQATVPAVETAPGALVSGTYYVAVSWTNAAGEEGAVSVPAVIKVSNTSFAVQTAAPDMAGGWNVYSGPGPDSMRRQNAAVLAKGEAWVQPDALATGGAAAGSGQAPSFFLAVPRTIQRG